MNANLPIQKNSPIPVSLILILIPLMAAAFAAAAADVPAAHRPLADSAVRHILECRFDEATSLADRAYSASPEDGGAALAAVLHTAALGMRDVDLDTTVDAAAFAASYGRAAAAVADYERARGGADSYTLTLRGFSLAAHASFHLRRGAYLAAAGTGFDAIKALKEAKALDAANTEPNFFLGLYDYAKADLKKRFWWVLFWYPGDKESGIRELEAGAQTAAITGAACSLALSDIYLKEKTPQRSRNIIYYMGRGMPNSRFVMWADAKYREDQGMYGQAADVFGKLADAYEKEPQGAYNAAATRSKQAQMQHKAGGPEAAATAANTCNYVIQRYGGSGNKRVEAVVRDVEKLLGKIKRDGHFDSAQ